MATTARYGYNPNRAGGNLLAFCNRARRLLIQRLVRPAARINEDMDAWHEHFRKIAAINAMDHCELRAAIKSTPLDPTIVLDPVDPAAGTPVICK